MGAVISRIVGVVGELLVTAGVLVLLFVGWQLFVDNTSKATSQQDIAASISKEWASEEGSGSTKTIGPDGDVPVLDKTTSGKVFGVLRIPRLGSKWVRTIASGTSQYILDNLGAGYYENTQKPGAKGNFALASHRGGNGSSFRYLTNMRIGDKIFIETKDGWYTYVYRNSVYIMATQGEVLNPIPQQTTTVTPTTRLLTMTTCNPYPFSTGERIAAYATFESFTPRGGQPPAGFATES